MRALAFLACLALSSAAHANETDPWYAWTRPPRDGTDALNRAINDRFARGLDTATQDMGCREAAGRMTGSLRSSALFFFFGDLQTWGVDYTPRTSSEYYLHSASNGSYRHVYGLMPLDPTMRAGDVLFGTDKLGHFFTNGLRQYDRYREVLAGGGSTEEALRAGIDEGIREEQTWLGLYPSGILSYADLEANFQGLSFFRALCDEGDLVRRGDTWTLRRPFDIARWVSPCWDEAWRPSYFGRGAEAAQRGLREMCTELRRPSVQGRLERYRAMGCHSASTRIVDSLVAAGALPDPSAWSFTEVCAPARAVGG